MNDDKMPEWKAINLPPLYNLKEIAKIPEVAALIEACKMGASDSQYCDEIRQALKPFQLQSDVELSNSEADGE